MACSPPRADVSEAGGFLIVEAKPMFVHALSNQPQHKHKIASTTKLTPGKHAIRFEFAYDGGGIGKGGTGTLLVDGTRVAQSRIERTVSRRFSLDETFDIGEDTGTPVIEDYVTRMPFRFNGTLDQITITLGPGAVTIDDAPGGAALPEVDP